MEVRIVSTLPKVSIEGDKIPLNNARLIKISFDEILEFENKQKSGVYNKLRFKYENSPPVFFEKWITVPDNIFATDNRAILLGLNHYSKPYIDACILALHFFTNRALLHSAISTRYYDYRSEKNFNNNPSLKNTFETIGAYRCVGESGREFSLQNGDFDVFIDNQSYPGIKEWYTFMESKTKQLSSEAIQHLIEPMQSLALPGINADTQQILLTGALESLLVPDVKTGINKHFTARFKNLCSQFQNHEDAIVRNTYKLRSSIIHGKQKDKEKILKKIGMSYGEYLDKLHTYSILSICKFLEGANEQKPMDVQLEAFRKRLSENAALT